MPEPVVIISIVIASCLALERLFQSISKHCKKSSCMGGSIEMRDSHSIKRIEEAIRPISPHPLSPHNSFSISPHPYAQQLASISPHISPYASVSSLTPMPLSPIAKRPSNDFRPISPPIFLEQTLMDPDNCESRI